MAGETTPTTFFGIPIPNAGFAGWAARYFTAFQGFDAVMKFLEREIKGLLTKNFTSDADLVLAAGEERYRFFKFTDTGVVLTAGRTVEFPDETRVIHVENATAQTLTIQPTGGAGVVLATGADAEIRFDGVGAAVAASVTGGDGVDVSGGMASVDLATDAGLEIAGGKLRAKTDGTTIERTADGLSIVQKPAFMAYNSSNDSNATGAGTEVYIDFDTELFDLGGDFASDTFTASAPGPYRFSYSVGMSGFSGASHSTDLVLITSNRNYYNFTNLDPLRNGSGISTGTYSVSVYMDAGDTAKVRANVLGMPGDTITIRGGTNYETTFSGELIC